MRTQLRRMGNSSAVIIPKPILTQLGIAAGDDLELAVEDNRVVIAPVRKHPRAGWAEASRAIAEAGDDALVWPEFGNEGDEKSRMVKRPAVVRGEVWLATLDPTVGSEIRKTRPCVVVSPPEMHGLLRTAIVVPMTTGSRPAPYRLPVRFQGQDGLVLFDQIRAVDKARLLQRLGALPVEALSAGLARLRDVFAD